MAKPQPFTPELVLRAYEMGYFPMAEPDGEIAWFSPDPRCVFELDGIRVSRSLRKSVQSGRFEVRIDTAFSETMRACADRADGTWISPTIFEVYRQLHLLGFAHSVESWCDGKLAGGLYGVALGAAFFGESMFHRVTDASKVALLALVERMKVRGYTLLDCQWQTPHLASLGAVEISRNEYLLRLHAALLNDTTFTD